MIQVNRGREREGKEGKKEGKGKKGKKGKEIQPGPFAANCFLRTSFESRPKANPKAETQGMLVFLLSANPVVKWYMIGINMTPRLPSPTPTSIEIVLPMLFPVLSFSLFLSLFLSLSFIFSDFPFLLC